MEKRECEGRRTTSKMSTALATKENKEMGQWP
jgi:hypothetical protein